MEKKYILRGKKFISKQKTEGIYHVVNIDLKILVIKIDLIFQILNQF